MTTPAEKGIQAAKEEAQKAIDREDLLVQADQKLWEAHRCWPHEIEKKKRLLKESKSLCNLSELL